MAGKIQIASGVVSNVFTAGQGLASRISDVWQDRVGLAARRRLDEVNRRFYDAAMADVRLAGEIDRSLVELRNAAFNTEVRAKSLGSQLSSILNEVH